MSEFDPTDIPAQDRDQRDKELRGRLARETEDADLKWLMESRQGRRIAWRILDRAGVFRLSFDTEPLVMAFREGARNEGLRVLARIHELCPDRYPQMMREMTDDDRDTDDRTG
ncbi:Bbp19 family protein [Guyparkeria halopsychrophila]|uniref:Bbp19 family protein n=1 Tax=Guyparkeria halopsychrophila TaxID=3139421 RepID=UPI0037CB1E25